MDRIILNRMKGLQDGQDSLPASVGKAGAWGNLVFL